VYYVRTPFSPKEMLLPGGTTATWGKKFGEEKRQGGKEKKTPFEKKKTRKSNQGYFSRGGRDFDLGKRGRGGGGGGKTSHIKWVTGGKGRIKAQQQKNGGKKREKKENHFFRHVTKGVRV